MPIDPRTLTQHQQRRRQVAASAKAAMRRDGLSLSGAARLHHIAPSTVRRWFPDSIVRDSRRRFQAIPDRERFQMVAVAVGGPVAIWTRGSRDRELLGAHGRAIQEALDPRLYDTRPLRALKRSRVAGVELETDPHKLVELFLGGELDFLEIYLTTTADA